MKIVFMGTPEYAVVILDRILKQNYDVAMVLTKPDKPVGRKGILTPSDVKKYLLKNNYKGLILEPQTLKNSEIQKQISDIKPDFIVVAAYGQILPKEILDICVCINLHASILPKFRGASPIQSAILAGEKISGVTAMKMGIGLDDGDMLAFSCLDISGLNSEELFAKLAIMAGDLTIKVIENYNKLYPIPQIHAISCKCGKVKKSYGEIKFKDNINEILKKFKAFTPWPGIFLQNGTKFLDIKPYSYKQTELGIISNLTKDGFCIGFAGGEIEVLKLQEPGRKPLNAHDFLNGKRLKIGDRIC